MTLNVLEGTQRLPLQDLLETVLLREMPLWGIGYLCGGLHQDVWLLLGLISITILRSLATSSDLIRIIVKNPKLPHS